MTLHVGFAEVDITPPVGIRLVGYYHRSAASQGVLDRLRAVALVMEQEGRRVTLVGLDHCGMLVPDVNRIRQTVAAELEVPISQVAILFTHTHAGPDDLDESLGETYREILRSKLRLAVRMAAERVRPCRVAWGMTRGRIGINRRVLGPDGRASMGENPNGPVDDRIGVLLFLDAHTNQRLGLMVTCTAHANVLKNDNLLISGDYPGRVRRLLQEVLGCPVLVRAGSAGNVNPLYRGGEDALEHMALAVSGPVLSLLPELKPVEHAPLWVDSETLPLLLQELPDPPQAEKLAERVSREWDVDTRPWLERVRTFLAQGRQALQVDLEVHLLRLGAFVLAGVPMEPFAELAITIQERLGRLPSQQEAKPPNPLAFFSGYTNGWLGYLPSREEIPRGGFEIERVPATYGLDSGMIMAPRPEAVDHVLETVVTLYQRSVEEAG
jgi:hypothetical protein